MELLNKCIVLVFLLSILPETYQVPLQKSLELDQNDNSAIEKDQSFGQRLKPRFPSRRLKSKLSSTSIPLTTSILNTTLPPPTTLLDTASPLKGRNFYALEPISVNKTEGFCAFEGKVYQSGDNIERKHLCHFCFCRNSYIDCYWKNCPPAPEGCVELTYEGVCERSLYLCPIPKKTKPVKSEIGNKNTSLGCDILGVKYRIGELVGVATDPCLECRCALDALYCSPKCCFQPAEPDDDVAQQIQRSDGYKPLQHNPLQHLRSDFEPGRDE